MTTCTDCIPHYRLPRFFSLFFSFSSCFSTSCPSYIRTTLIYPLLPLTYITILHLHLVSIPTLSISSLHHHRRQQRSSTFPPLLCWRPSTPPTLRFSIVSCDAEPLTPACRLARRACIPHPTISSPSPAFPLLTPATMPKVSTKEDKKVKAVAPEKKKRTKKEKDPNKPKR